MASGSGCDLTSGCCVINGVELFFKWWDDWGIPQGPCGYCPIHLVGVLRNSMECRARADEKYCFADVLAWCFDGVAEIRLHALMFQVN